MVFVYPSFLWALATLTVPIILHLFNFRRYKKVYFTNVRFLRELQIESKSRSRLKQLLILLCRCLAIAALVVAFSQPVVPTGAAPLAQGAKTVSIYIDNSFSMANVNAQGPLLEVAKTRAKDLVGAFGAGDRFQIVTNDFEGRHQNAVTRDNALVLIDEIRVSPVSRQLSDVLARQRAFLNGHARGARRVFVLSDAQRSTFDLERLTDDSVNRSTLVPLVANRVNNVYVDSCWFESPLQQKGFVQKLHATVVNNGNNAIEAGSAKLFLNTRQIAIASFSLPAGQRTEVEFSFECRNEGLNFGSVKIEDYPVTFDDELYFAFNSRIHLEVTLLNGPGQAAQNPLSTLFESDSLFRLRSYTAESVDYSSFKSSHLLVLNQLPDLSSGLISELLKFTTQEGAVIIIPPDGADVTSYATAFAALQLPLLGRVDSLPQKAERLDGRQDFYAGVFEKLDERMNLPNVNWHYQLERKARSNFEPVIRLLNGDPFFGFTRSGNATVYLFTAPLHDIASNFSRHALFVPTFYQSGFRSVKAGNLFYTSGVNRIIQLRNSLNAAEQPPHIRELNGGEDFIPESRVVNNGLYLYTRGQLTKPGFFTVQRGADTLLPLAFNYSRRESDLGVYETADLEKILAARGLTSVDVASDSGVDLPARLLAGVEGKKLWKLFIILTLVFLALEAALLRLLK